MTLRVVLTPPARVPNSWRRPPPSARNDSRPPQSCGTEWTRPFDDDEVLTGELDLASARRPTREQRRVSVEQPYKIAPL